MLKKVISVIKEYNLIEKNDKFVLGISGGPDSMCLFEVLKFISEKNLLGFTFELVVCHIDHGTRNGESTKDAQFVEEYCRSKNTPFYSYRYNLEEEANKLNMSQEEAGRFLRYNAFRKVLAEANATKIATAHNLDDNVETVFLNIIRGTGLTGLTGIKIKNDNIIRPLLSVQKSEIIDFLKENNIPYVVDYTNNETFYTRNKIRNELLPYVKENINSNVLNSISNSIKLLTEDAKTLDDIAKEKYEEIKKLKEETESNNAASVNKKIILLECVKFDNNVLSIKRRILRNAIKEVNNGSLKDISLVYIDNILKLVPGKEIDLPYGIKVFKTYENIVISNMNSKNNKKQDDLEDETKYKHQIYDEISNKEGKYTYTFTDECSNEKVEYELNYKIYDLSESSSQITLEDIKANKDKYVAYFDSDKIKGKVIVRTRKDGDKITINENGNTRKVKDILIDEKVNKKDRDSILIIEDKNIIDDNESIIMDVLGYRWNPTYKVDETTKKVLKIWQSKKIK